jgi:hypothetical protein
MMAVVFVLVAVKQQRDREEEEVAPVEDDGPVAYEYKIMRSNLGAFKKPAKLRAVLEAEAAAGWDLYEKLDCSRLRLRRPVSCRLRDGELAQDPYRTTVGAGGGAVALWVVLGTLAGIGAMAGLILVLANRP